MAQLEREASFDSSEPTSITNSSTVEGEHTIQGPGRGEVEVNPDEDEEEDDRTLATTPDEEAGQRQRRTSLDENAQSFSPEDINLLKSKLEEVSRKWRCVHSRSLWELNGRKEIGEFFE